MDKIKALLYFCLSAGIFFSCSSDPEIDPNGGNTTKNLIVVTTIADDTLSFKSGDQMGVFVAKTDGGLYPGTTENIKSEYSSGWKTAMQSPLSGEPAQVYAYYPYTPMAQLTAVPVKTDGKTPVLYSEQSADQDVSNANNQAKLTMKHALSTLAFNFTKKNYYGAGRLEKVEILNAPGKRVFADRGTLDCTTGKITPAPEDTAHVTKDCKLDKYQGESSNINVGLRQFPLIRSIPEGTPDEKNLQCLRVFPMVVSEGDVIFRFTIDGVQYDCPVAGTEWKAGQTHMYTFCLEGEAVNIDGLFNVTWAQPGDPVLSYSYDLVPFPEEAKPAILQAIKIWTQCLDIKVPINAKFAFAWPLPGAMAVAPVGSSYIGDNRDYRYTEVLKNQLIGYDAEPNSTELEIIFNAKTWFYYGLDNQYLEEPIDESAYYVATDLISTTLHEMCHSFGFTSTLSPNPDTQIGTKAIQTPEPIDMDIFGSFMVDENGRSLKDYPNRSKELYDALISGKIAFAGPNAIRANGGKPVPMADNPPSPYWNTSHLGGFNIMSGAGAFHHPGVVILAMLQDIGWELKPLPKMKPIN